MALSCHKKSPMARIEKGPGKCRSFVDSVSGPILPTCGRNDGIHPQVLYHLPVVVETMPYD